MQHTVVEAVSEGASQPEDPLQREIAEPHSLPECGECLFRGRCACSSTRTIAGEEREFRVKLFPLLNKLVETGGKKSVRANAERLDSAGLQEVLASTAYGIDNLQLASCVNQQNIDPIRHAVSGILHRRRSAERNVVKKKSYHFAKVERRPEPPVEDVDLQPEMTTWEYIKSFFG